MQSGQLSQPRVTEGNTMMGRMGIALGTLLLCVAWAPAQSSPYVVKQPLASTPAPPPPSPSPTTWLPPAEPKAPVPMTSFPSEPYPITPVSHWQPPAPTADEPSLFTPTAWRSEAPSQTTQPSVAPPVASEPPRFRVWDSGGGLDGNGSFWVSADAVAAWFRGMELPPLVTTAPAGTPRAVAGALNQPTTSLLFGGTVDRDIR